MSSDPPRIHPARARLLMRGIEVREAAAAIGCTRSHLSSVLRSVYPATPRLRRALAEFLDEPESTLFLDSDATPSDPPKQAAS
jgi:transcriptional regulator with XRE-family HTH domain